MKLYRAIPKSKLDVAKRYERGATLRAPSNIPFLVDNILENLRPDHMRSRRHAVYASPTPELALANASAVLAPGDAMAVCELAFVGRVKVAHLAVSDARYHSDIRAITAAVLGALNDKQAGEAAYGARAELAPLFMPWLRAHDIQALQDQCRWFESCCNVLRRSPPSGRQRALRSIRSSRWGSCSLSWARAPTTP